MTEGAATVGQSVVREVNALQGKAGPDASAGGFGGMNP